MFYFFLLYVIINYIIGVIKVNKKGQALIEFVLILPILIMILFSIIDFGRIYTTKSDLESILSDIILNNYTSNEINEYIETKNINANVDVRIDNNIKKITMTKEIDLITPLLNVILDNPYTISIERVIKIET